MKGRFTMSSDNEKDILHLQMSNLRTEDMGMYTVQVTQCVYFSVSLDTNLPAGTLITGRGRWTADGHSQDDLNLGSSS
jgi:hypothetical protein